MDIDKNNEAYYLIRGGTPLYGEIPLSGAKNAITKMIIASLLTGEPCLLRNVPLIGDFDLALALCREMGSKIRLQDHTLSIATPSIRSSVVSTKVGGLNRMAIITVGPLLHRCGEADIPKPGGDRILVFEKHSRLRITFEPCHPRLDRPYRVNTAILKQCELIRIGSRNHHDVAAGLSDFESLRF